MLYALRLLSPGLVLGRSDMPARSTTATKSTSRQRSPIASRRKPVLRFRMRITDGESIAVGPGKIALLEAIESTGSITSAAKTLQMSYRRAWLLVHELDQSMRTPVVETSPGGQRGGGSVLTEAGRQLIFLYRRIEDNATLACRGDIEQLMKMLAR